MYNGNFGNFEDLIALAQQAENGGTVTLLQDISFGGYDITIEKGHVILELSTCYLKGFFNIIIKEGATLTIDYAGMVGYGDYGGMSINNEGRLNLKDVVVHMPIVNKGTMEIKQAMTLDRVSAIGGSTLTVKEYCTIDTLYIEKTNDGTPSISLCDSVLKYIKSVSNPTTLTPLTLSGMLANGYGVKYQGNWVDGTLTEVGDENSTDRNIRVDKVPTPAASDFTFTPPSNLTYDGNAKTATVTTDKSGIGAITVKYYDESGTKLENEPTNAGKYTVKIDVADVNHYKEYSVCGR